MQIGELETFGWMLHQGGGGEAANRPERTDGDQPAVGAGGPAEFEERRGYRREWWGRDPQATSHPDRSERKPVECYGEQRWSPFDSSPIEWVREFGRCMPWLEDALDHNGGTHNLADVFKGIAEQRYQFWPCKTCAMVSEILLFPQKRVFNMFLVGGDGSAEIQVARPFAEAWAKTQGCTSVTLTGRRGWERLKWLKDAGYNTVQLTLEKEL